jgi:hypothetical protein
MTGHGGMQHLLRIVLCNSSESHSFRYRTKFLLKHLIEDVLHGAVWRGGAGGDADGQRPLRQPAVRRRQLPPALHLGQHRVAGQGRAGGYAVQCLVT